MPMTRIALIAVALLFTSAATFAADPFPNKPLRAIVPFAPGGATDIVMRLIAVKLADALGQPVVVENSPGGGTARHRPGRAGCADGYTLMVVTAALAINPACGDAHRYDSFKDFAPVTHVADPNIARDEITRPVSAMRTRGRCEGESRKMSYGSPG